jgi:acetylornithine deacetylase/succinyl-diaminopimelate desuccinylase-like protein
LLTGDTPYSEQAAHPDAILPDMTTFMTMRHRRATAARAFIITQFAIASTAAGAQAQGTVIPSRSPKVEAALAAIRADNEWTLDQQASICEIPAPPFKESARAAEFARRLKSVGYADVRIDSEGNVIATRPGKGSGPSVMIAGHLDTVFPEGTNVKVTRQGRTMKGPGIGDDCRGLAVVLQVARALNKAGIETDGTIYLVGNVGEEGPGDLRGVKHLFRKELSGKIDYFITVDAPGLGLVSRAVGSHRYRVTFTGPGGHSYGAFGIPNPIHAMGRAIAKIADMKVPDSPKTTFNVGIVSGGTSVNSISEHGVMEIDMRSESAAELSKIDARIQSAIVNALKEENGIATAVTRRNREKERLTVSVDTVGIRPTGAQSDTALIVRTAKEAAKLLGVTTRTGASSTDANLPISMGIPAIRINGGGEGSGAHSLSEDYDDTDKGYLGPQWALLIVTALARAR